MDEREQDDGQPGTPGDEFRRTGPGVPAVRPAGPGETNSDQIPYAASPARRFRSRAALLSVSAVVLIVLAGAVAYTMGSKGSNVAPAASTTNATTDGGSFQSTGDLLSQLAAQHQQCENSTPFTVAASGEVDSAGCQSPEGTGTDTVIVLFENSADAQAFADNPGLSNNGQPVETVRGANWVVFTIASYATAVHSAIGGTISPVAAPITPAVPIATTMADSTTPPAASAGLDPATCSALANAWSTFQSSSTGATNMSQELDAVAAYGETVNALGNAPLVRQFAADLVNLEGVVLQESTADELYGTASPEIQASVSTNASQVASDHQAVVAACG